MQDRNIGNDKLRDYLEIYASAVFILFALLAYFDVISKFVPIVLILDGVVAVFSLFFIGFYIYIKHPRFMMNIPTFSFLIFCLFTLISMIINKGDLDRNIVAVFGFIQLISIMISVFVLKDHLRDVIRYLGYFVVLFAVIVLSFSFEIFSEDRGAGITGNPNLLGSLLTMSLIIIAYLELIPGNKYMKLLFACCAVYLFAGLCKTESRTAELCLIAGISALCVFMILRKIEKRHRLLISVVLLLFLILVFVFIVSPKIFFIREESKTVFTSREIIWRDSLEAVKGHFVLGFGGNSAAINQVFESFASYVSILYARNHFLHNIYIQILVEYGIVALIGFCMFVLSLVFNYLLKFFSSDEKTQDSAFIFGVALMVVCLLHGVTESCLLYFGGIEQFMLCVASAILFISYIRKKD